MNRKILRSRQLRCRGVVSVEAALVTPLLLTLLFGIVEFGFIFKDLLLLHQGAREGARVAAVGAETVAIADRIDGSLPTLNPDELTVTLEYRTYDGAWSDWTPLGDYEGENYAPAGSQIRVTLEYLHPLACGPFFSRFIGEPGDTTVPLSSGMVMSREQ
jgi:hypothetical protein